MGSYLTRRTHVRPSAVGLGVFAREKIPAGEIVADFQGGTGRSVSLEKSRELAAAGFDYMIQIDDDVCFAATDTSELEDGYYVNHSCAPNCGLRGPLALVAMRDIAKGEELTFD